jgi:signal transduction histidine kinase
MEILVTILTAFANTLLGLFTLVKNPRSATNQLFFLLTIIISSWAVSNYFSLHSSTPEQTLFWIRMVMLITSPMGPTILLLVKAFPDVEINLKKKLLYPIIGLAVADMLLAFTPLMFSSVSIVNGNITPQPGPAMLLFALSFAGCPVAAFIALFLKYIKSTGLRKTQIRYFLLGIILTFSLMVVTNLFFVVILKISSFVIFGPMFSLILVSFTAYAIVKHRFLDIQFLVARSVAYALLVFLIATIYAAVIFAAEKFITRTPVSPASLFLSVGVALLITLSFQILKEFFERFTEKVFYQHGYDRQKLLEKLTHIMASTLELGHLVEKILFELQKKMKISDLSIALIKNERITFFKKQSEDEGSRSNDELLIKLAQFAFEHTEDKAIIFEELPESSIKEMMRTCGLSVVLALMVKGELYGALFLASKNTGGAYSLRDIEVLKILTPEFAVAIQNALAYEEIRQFNYTLEREVEHATRQLRTANDKLKELDKLKDEFVSIASHELRTPMGAIKSMISMILEGDYGKVTPQLKEPLNDMSVSVERLINLVNNMLNISRIEAGRMKFILKEFPIDAVVKRAATSLAPLAKTRNVKMAFEALVPELVQADQEKVEQILNNLIGNSLKFTPDGGTVTLGTKVEKDLVVITVCDTGVGIDPTDQEKLFGKFQQVANEKIGKPVGTGLGLYISRELARKLGGNLWVVHSELGKGSTFAFSIPLAGSEKAKEVQHDISSELDPPA